MECKRRVALIPKEEKVLVQHLPGKSNMDQTILMYLTANVELQKILLMFNEIWSVRNYLMNFKIFFMFLHY